VFAPQFSRWLCFGCTKRELVSVLTSPPKTSKSTLLYAGRLVFRACMLSIRSGKTARNPGETTTGLSSGSCKSSGLDLASQAVLKPFPAKGSPKQTPTFHSFRKGNSDASRGSQGPLLPKLRRHRPQAPGSAVTRRGAIFSLAAVGARSFPSACQSGADPSPWTSSP
jgi:hypothetical protein